MVGLLGIEPRLQDPQPCVLPLYYSPFPQSTLSDCRFHYLSLCRYSQTLNTQQGMPSVWKFGFLQIWIFAAPVGGIIMTAKQLARAGHQRSLAAMFTLFHREPV